ncbi:hypothetical protein GW916_13245 [bacterium]|nr:hypothetical protein [bacterium]
MSNAISPIAKQDSLTPSTSYPLKNTIYVSNVASHAELSDLEDLFVTVGDIKTQSLEIIPESGHGMEFGVFEMFTEQQAKDCVERFNGSVNEGKQLSVTSFRPVRRPSIHFGKKGAKKRGS